MSERYVTFGEGEDSIEVTQCLHQGKVELEVDFNKERPTIYMEADTAIKMALNILKVCNYEGEIN